MTHSKKIGYMFIANNGSDYEVETVLYNEENISSDIVEDIKKNGFSKVYDYALYYDISSKDSQKKAIKELSIMSNDILNKKIKEIEEQKEKIMNVIKEKENKIFGNVVYNH